MRNTLSALLLATFAYASCTTAPSAPATSANLNPANSQQQSQSIQNPSSNRCGPSSLSNASQVPLYDPSKNYEAIAGPDITTYFEKVDETVNELFFWDASFNFSPEQPSLYVLSKMDKHGKTLDDLAVAGVISGYIEGNPREISERTKLEIFCDSLQMVTNNSLSTTRFVASLFPLTSVPSDAADLISYYRGSADITGRPMSENDRNLTYTSIILSTVPGGKIAHVLSKIPALAKVPSFMSKGLKLVRQASATGDVFYYVTGSKILRYTVKAGGEITEEVVDINRFAKAVEETYTGVQETVFELGPKGRVGYLGHLSPFTQRGKRVIWTLDGDPDTFRSLADVGAMRYFVNAEVDSVLASHSFLNNAGQIAGFSTRMRAIYPYKTGLAIALDTRNITKLYALGKTNLAYEFVLNGHAVMDLLLTSNAPHELYQIALNGIKRGASAYPQTLGRYVIGAANEETTIRNILRDVILNGKAATRGNNIRPFSPEYLFLRDYLMTEGIPKLYKDSGLEFTYKILSQSDIVPIGTEYSQYAFRINDVVSYVTIVGR